MTIFNIEDVDADLTQFHGRAVALHGLQRAPVILTDSGYAESSNIHTPFAHAPDGGDAVWEARHNLLLSQCRVPNEWAFGRCKNTWRTLANTDVMKVQWTAPEKSFIVALLLTNCKVCSEGSQHEQYFGFSPPPLEAYLKETMQ